MNRRRPEALLADWRAAGLPFRTRPELVGELAGGRSNRSFLLSVDGAYWVLRLDAQEASVLGVDRVRERRLHAAAAAAGLAPEVAVADVERGFMVTRFVDGERHAANALSEARLDELLTLLATTGQLEVDVPALDYRAHAESYAGGAPLSADLLARIARVEGAGVAGLCHHDPTPANVVFTPGGPVLLDWEYAAPGRPVMDLAALACEWPVGLEVVAEAAGVERALLADACVVYRALCALWAERMVALTQ